MAHMVQRKQGEADFCLQTLSVGSTPLAIAIGEVAVCVSYEQCSTLHLPLGKDFTLSHHRVVIIDKLQGLPNTQNACPSANQLLDHQLLVCALVLILLKCSDKLLLNDKKCLFLQFLFEQTLSLLLRTG